MALTSVICPECNGRAVQGIYPCGYCWGVGEVDRQFGGHADWCHIDMDCCGCTCRDAYTEYYEQQVRRRGTQED